MMKIVVMGGSFNPPTVAHQRLLLGAVKELEANMGIFVPSSHTYVSIKMRRAKFTQNEDLKWRLIATGDAYLEEGNTWHDTCWGVDAKTGVGENHLGKILMKVRSELQGK